MNKIKLAVVALLAAFALSFAAPSHAENASLAPSYGNGIRHQNRDFAPNKTKRIVQSTAATLLASGEGFLDAICPIGGTLGKYSMALDSGASALMTLDDLSLAIAPRVFVNTDTTSAGTSGSGGCWNANPPRKFVNGLVGIQSDSAHATLFVIHCSDGSNPCSL